MIEVKVGQIWCSALMTIRIDSFFEVDIPYDAVHAVVTEARTGSFQNVGNRINILISTLQEKWNLVSEAAYERVVDCSDKSIFKFFDWLNSTRPNWRTYPPARLAKIQTSWMAGWAACNTLPKIESKPNWPKEGELWISKNTGDIVHVTFVSLDDSSDVITFRRVSDAHMKYHISTSEFLSGFRRKEAK